MRTHWNWQNETRREYYKRCCEHAIHHSEFTLMCLNKCRLNPNLGIEASKLIILFTKACISRFWMGWCQRQETWYAVRNKDPWRNVIEMIFQVSIIQQSRPANVVAKFVLSKKWRKMHGSCNCCWIVLFVSSLGFYSFDSLSSVCKIISQE